jgi:hypothetical protein
MAITHQTTRQTHGWAWLALTAALAVHVADEALNDFLSVYNPAVEAIRARLAWWPMPTFTFDVWLGGLLAAVVLLALLSVFVFQGARVMRPLSYFYAGLMLLNGCGHIAGSFYLGRMMPGVYSSPLLLAASLWLFDATRRAAAGHLGVE